MSNAKILVADYDDKSLATIDEALKESGCATILVRNGKDALEKIQSEKPDLCIIDPMLPGINGFMLSQKARGINPRLPIVISTAVYKGDKYQRDAKTKYGVNAYLEKPYSNQQLVQTVQDLIAKNDAPVKALDESIEKKLGSTLTELSSNKPRKKSKMDVEANVDKLLEHTLSGIEIGGRSKKVTVSVSPPKIPAPKKPALAPNPAHADDSATMRVSADDLKREMEKIKQALPPSEPAPAKEVLPSLTQPQRTLEEKLTSSDIFGALIDDIESDDEPNAPAAPSTQIPPPISQKEKPEVKVTVAPPKPQAPPPKPAPQAEPVRAAVEPAKPAVEPAKATPSPEPPSPSELPKTQSSKKRPELSKTNEYQLLSKIAAGGMAEVWKARLIGEKGFEKIVAIKKILPHLSDNDEFITMFIDEAKVAANLTHPNIAQIYELGKMGNSFFIAMEYVSGNNLRTVINLCNELGVTVPPEIASFIGMKLCSALNYAHTKKDFGNRDLNIVHRDISPQNILISSEGEIKLVDFGIAKASIKASQTVAGSLKGKLLYMSPEQADGKPIDARSDIFSLGNVMYECLTGKKLIAGDSELSILKNVRDAVFPKPSSLNPRIVPQLEKIMMVALAKEVDERFATAKDMEKDLKDFMKAGKYHINESDVADFMKSLFAKDMSKLSVPEAKKAKPQPTPKPAVIMPDTGQIRAHEAGHPILSKPAKQESGGKGWLYGLLAAVAIVVAVLSYMFWPKGETSAQPPVVQQDEQTLPLPQTDTGADKPVLDEATIESIRQEIEAQDENDPNEGLKSELEKKRDELRKLYKEIGYTEEQIEAELSKLN
ncbi:MAG: protein kinase [Acidobacteria bacterium]|nr:protein kinase [Acidobacteriota bacterium]